MAALDVKVREAVESDPPAILDVLNAAFGAVEGPEIVGLVGDLLRDPSARPLLSLVATTGEQVVGYILFTRTQIVGAVSLVSSSILAPLAVHPDYQGQGIGGKLINEGLNILRSRGVDLVFVLGHPGYYPRFGFEPAGSRGLEAPYPIAPEHADAWMVQELRPVIIKRVRGRVVCADKLNDPKYWQE